MTPEALKHENNKIKIFFRKYHKYFISRIETFKFLLVLRTRVFITLAENIYGTVFTPKEQISSIYISVNRQRGSCSCSVNLSVCHLELRTYVCIFYEHYCLYSCMVPDTALFTIKILIFFLYLHKKVCCGTHEKRLSDALLISTQNIFLMEN